MGKIIILDENTANKIAAGEVIERPASVIKELVENSIDAGATSVSVEIRNGGISFIRVIDNGSGLAADDVEIAFERHATSKIRRAEDLENISSMGFRGEALASIAAVSSVQLSTRTKEEMQGVSIEIRGGSVVGIKPAGCPTGTSITVRELFFNTPARYKFLKKDTTEAGYVADVLGRIALGYPDISFKLVSGGAVVLHTPGNGDLKSAIFSVYGPETAKQLIEVKYDDGQVKIAGYISKAELSFSNRSRQSIYINRRYIRSKTITSAIDAAYATFLMKNRYAFALLDVRINPLLVDVNVHPTKMEVKFSNEQDIYRAVYHAVNDALLNRSEVRTLPGAGIYDRNAYNLHNKEAGKASFSQQTIGAINDKKACTSSGTRLCNARDFEPVRKELEQKRAEAIAGLKPQESLAEGNSDYIADKLNSSGCLKAVAGADAPFDSDTQDALNYDANQNINAETEHFPSLFAGARLVGQAFSTYIFLERGDELYLLDQHAAHERIRYEKLKEAYEKKEPLRQMLLSVISIELSGGEYQFAMNETGFFRTLGFEYESFGTNSIILRAVPFDGKETDIRSAFLEVLDLLMSGRKEERNALADEALYRMACKSAVKANKKLDEREIEALLAGLAALENPYTCPHGRPAILKLRKYELEKLFKRIV